MKKGSKKKENTPSFKISHIRIMLDTNVDENPVVFTYSMLATPGLPKNAQYKYPYFTNSLKYDDDFLLGMSLENRMKFLFNKSEFSRIITDMADIPGNNHIDYKANLEGIQKAQKAGPTNESVDSVFSKQAKQESENEQHNIILVLKYLFPIHPKFNEYLKRTDYEILGKMQMNIFKLNTPDVMDSINYFGWMNKIGAISNEYGGSYLSIGKGPSIVKNVVWENDIVNHPVYSNFLKTYNAKMADIENSFSEITKKKIESQNLFVEKIEKYMEKELDVKLDTKTKISFGPNVSDTYLLSFYYQDNQVKSISDNKTPHPNAKNSFNPYEYGLNPIYDKIHGRWIDNLGSSMQSSSKSSEIRSSAQIIMKELSEFLKKVVEYRQAKAENMIPQTDKLIESYTNLIKILDENYALKSKIGTLLSFGDGERAMNDLFMAAIDLNALDKIDNFIEKKELFNIDISSQDDTLKIESETRTIKHLQNTYPVFANLSKSLVDTLKSVLPPDRKTSNTELYDLLLKTKTGNANGKEKVIEELYNRYIRKSGADTKINLKPYLYTGVDTIIGKRDNTEGDTKDQASEIYVKIDLINKSEYEANPNCLVRDNDLNNHLQLLLENKYPYPMINPNRKYIMEKGTTEKGTTEKGTTEKRQASTTDKKNIDLKKKRVGGRRRANYTKRRNSHTIYTRKIGISK